MECVLCDNSTHLSECQQSMKKVRDWNFSFHFSFTLDMSTTHLPCLLCQIPTYLVTNLSADFTQLPMYFKIHLIHIFFTPFLLFSFTDFGEEQGKTSSSKLQKKVQQVHTYVLSLVNVSYHMINVFYDDEIDAELRVMLL